MEIWRDTESIHIDIELDSIREENYPSSQERAEDSISEENYPPNQERADRLLAKVTKLENTILILNFILEIPSAIFDQLSSVRKLQYGLVSMLMSYVVLFMSILDLVLKGRKERVRLMMKSWIPWFYYPSPNHSKPFGKFFDIMGLICGILQCVFTSIAYYFWSNNEDSPIKLNFWPIVFASALLFSKNACQSNEPLSHKEKEERENVGRRRPLTTRLEKAVLLTNEGFRAIVKAFIKRHKGVIQVAENKAIVQLSLFRVPHSLYAITMFVVFGLLISSEFTQCREELIC